MNSFILGGIFVVALVGGILLIAFAARKQSKTLSDKPLKEIKQLNKIGKRNWQ